VAQNGFGQIWGLQNESNWKCYRYD
jgi:hypothetical protein